MSRPRSLVCGIGVNDADRVEQSAVKGDPDGCALYQVWAGMLRRCYIDSFHSKRPTYVGCSVCEEWLIFSNFRRWMEKQDWKGKEVDKDILVVGNKIYSPETCVLVDGMTNTFTVDNAASRGDYPIGVSFYKGKYRARCRNPFTKKEDYLGLFTDPFQAHQAWKKRKHELACQLADLQTDERVAAALRVRYL